MRRTLTRPATAIVALMLAGALGCAAAGSRSTPRQAAQRAASPAIANEPSAAVSGVRITQAAFNEDSDGARVVLSADAPLLYTSYEPRPDLLVVDLPGANVSGGFAPPAATGSLVSSIRVEPVLEMGKPATRISIAHREGLRSDVRSLGQGLAISFEPVAEASATSGATAPETAAPSPVAEAAPSSTTPPIVTEQIGPSPSTRAEVAHLLEELQVRVGGAGEVTVALLGDGTLTARDFLLENPPRLVIDLPGVRNQVRRRVVPVQSRLVSRVRVSQFQSAPQPVTRVVLDLTRPSAHAVTPEGERLTVVVRSDEMAAVEPSSQTTIAEPPSRTTIAEAPVRAPEEKTAREDARPEAPAPAAEVPARPPEEKNALKETSPQAPPPAATAPATETAPAPPPAPVPAPAPAQTAAAESRSAPTPVKLAPGIQKAQKSAPSSSASRPAREKASPREEALFEAAAAMLTQDEGARPETPQATYQPRTIAENQTQFTGEPISLDLKDADIKDVFRTISQLTQLNIVVDPEVRGTVTVQLEDVPWDQALDLILKQNGLGYVLENNIMRIATTQKLQAEQADRLKLMEARQAAEPTRTVIKKLSYAKASELTPTIKSVMSRRGDITVDVRTNTLIIREIPTYLPAVLQLIENLDTATPQVMIEARIVETTKSLGRNLGIAWGATGAADVAHGNTTGLVFPNNATGTFNVPLGTPQTILTARLGNILNSFNLDVALSAAENQGLLKIISSPKVAAVTNTAATIQSGVQIPVQTNVNNTTTVIYVDATLKLTVTPQITNEGTILMSVNVQKREPAVALNLSIGQNVPLTVRQYQGDILVRDGATSVIGGIFQINDEDQNNMIPGLWKIPILGNLFRNKTRTEKHDELLIFITPRILKP
jgi:type IV pilus assembly protein PilQ